MKSFKEYITEASLGRLHQHMQGRNIGILSAHRGNLSHEENTKRHAQLKKDVRDAGYGYVNVHGHYTENKGTPQERKVKEHSIVVIGKKGDDNGHLKGFLKKHGEKYNQDSILHKSHDSDEAHLIGTSHSSDWLKHGEHMSVGKFHPNKAGEFHSKLRNKTKTFQFEDEEKTDIDVLEDVNLTYDKYSTFFSRDEGEYTVDDNYFNDVKE